MSESPEVPVDKLAAVYIKIRDRKSELKKAFDEEYGALTKQQDRISTAMLQYCKDNNLTGFKTPAGTVARKTQVKYWTSDWESMHKFILEQAVPEFLTKSLNQTNVRAFMEDNPDIIPPGMNVDSTYVISVTKPRKKM